MGEFLAVALLFYLVAGVTLAAALIVVFQRTPVYSALALIVVLCSLAVLYLVLGADFVAMIQVIVYAGAIMVLFVLVIMLLNARREPPTSRSRLARWLGAPLLVAFLIELVLALSRRFSAHLAWPAPLEAGPREIGNLLFQNYALPFEVTSILILVAVLGAVALAKKDF